MRNATSYNMGAMGRITIVQGYPRSSTLVPIESPYATSYGVQ